MKLTVILILIATCLSNVVQGEDKLIMAEAFLEKFAIPETEMKRLISIEAPPAVRITINFDTNSAEVAGKHNLLQLE